MPHLLDVRRRPLAFTMIELIVVIVILGLLAAIAAVSYRAVVDNSQREALRHTGLQFEKEARALAAYGQDAPAKHSTEVRADLSSGWSVTPDTTDARKVLLKRVSDGAWVCVYLSPSYASPGQIAGIGLPGDTSVSSAAGCAKPVDALPDLSDGSSAVGGLLPVLAGTTGAWSLNETSGPALDRSGNGLNGTYNTTGVTRGVAPLVNGGDASAAFNSSQTGGAKLPGVADFANGSLEAWFSTTTVKAAHMAIIGRSGQYAVYVKNGNLMMYDMGASRWIDTGVNVADGRRHYMVLAVQDNVVNGANIYLDGVLVKSDKLTRNNDYGAAWYIASDGAGQNFDGTIDDAALYNVVLTPAQIASRWNAGK